jgi:hypothetical protein
MPITNEDAKQKIDNLLDKGVDCYNNWEVDFLTDKIDKTEFTDNGLNKIEELWEEHCK